MTMRVSRWNCCLYDQNQLLLVCGYENALLTNFCSGFRPTVTHLALVKVSSQGFSRSLQSNSLVKVSSQGSSQSLLCHLQEKILQLTTNTYSIFDALTRSIAKFHHFYSLTYIAIIMYRYKNIHLGFCEIHSILEKLLKQFRKRKIGTFSNEWTINVQEKSKEKNGVKIHAENCSWNFQV